MQDQLDKVYEHIAIKDIQKFLRRRVHEEKNGSILYQLSVSEINMEKGSLVVESKNKEKTNIQFNTVIPTNLHSHSRESALGGAVGLGTVTALGATKPIPLVAATIAGASVGYYVSTLRFASAGIYQVGGQVYKLGDYVTIEIPTDNIFEVNSTEPLPEAEPVLKSAANVLKRYDCQNIVVSGNTSGFGTTKYERRISEGRAKEVAAFLWSEGINSLQNLRKLTYVGYGNYFPIASDLRNKGIRQNSRIQITAYPTKDQLLINEKAMAFNNIAGLGATSSKTIARNENIGRYTSVPEGGYKQEF